MRKKKGGPIIPSLHRKKEEFHKGVDISCSYQKKKAFFGEKKNLRGEGVFVREEGGRNGGGEETSVGKKINFTLPKVLLEGGAKFSEFVGGNGKMLPSIRTGVVASAKEKPFFEGRKYFVHHIKSI